MALNLVVKLIANALTRSVGAGCRWRMPFQARFTRCAATAGLSMVVVPWASIHHCPASATSPTSICA